MDKSSETTLAASVIYSLFDGHVRWKGGHQLNHLIELIFVFKRWRDLLKKDRQVRHMMDFHTRHKYLIMSHSPRHYSLMGRLVSGMKRETLAEDMKTYVAMLTEAMMLKATVAKHVNVLQHIAGYFKWHITPDEKRELAELIEQYRAGRVPLIAPITLINGYVRKTAEPYLRNQIYLNPSLDFLRIYQNWNESVVDNSIDKT